MLEGFRKKNARESERDRSVWHRLGLLLLLGGALAVSGCARITPNQQRLLSKPNMQFSDSRIFGYDDKLLNQIESGSASFGGNQSAGCASCGVGL